MLLGTTGPSLLENLIISTGAIVDKSSRKSYIGAAEEF